LQAAQAFLSYYLIWAYFTLKKTLYNLFNAEG